MKQEATVMTSSNQQIKRGGTQKMFSAIRRRLTFANVAMTLALVFAMSGGAYAAGKYLIISTKQIKPSVLKQLQGKAGPAGPEGKQGLAGPEGKQGAAGTSGKDGAAGEKGAQGPAGTTGPAGVKGKNVVSNSFEATHEPLGEPCKKAGGSEFEVEGSGTKTYACNGSAASGGSLPSCLPEGQSETGQYSINAAINEENWHKNMYAPISFPIPLCTGKTVTPHFIAIGEADPAGCKGEVLTPEAENGNLCVFEKSSNGFHPHEEEVEYCGQPMAKVLINPVSFLSVETGSGEIRRSGTNVVFRDTEELKNALSECGKVPAGHAFDTGDWVMTAP